MLGVIERIKNAVLFKCNSLNDKVIADYLNEIIDTFIYHFAEDIVSITNDLDESKIREDVSEVIKVPIIKKIKRKLFIDSLALQVTNDTFIEDYVEGKTNLDKIKKEYLKNLKSNKNSNQLNMTEDLNISNIFDNVKIYCDMNIIPLISESKTLTDNINKVVTNSKKELQKKLEELIKETDNKYLDILLEELKNDPELINREEEYEEEKEEVNMGDTMINEKIEKEVIKPNSNFEKYDDITLFNKALLSLNTKEEVLTRKENKLEERKKEVEERLSETNKSIEENIERENALSKRKFELNEKEIKLNAKLSETEVILLNIKPLIKGLNNIKSSNEEGE